MNIKEKEQIELLSKVIGRRINQEAIKVVIMYINDRHKPAFYPED